MKRLLIIISLLLPMTIAAQDATFRDMRRDTSTRGVEFSIKAIGSPGGFHDVYNAKGYVCGGVGGEAILSYRINKAFSVGIGVNVTRAWFGKDAFAWQGIYGWDLCGTTTVLGNLKVNIKEKRKFTPYVSLSFGVDWLDRLDTGEETIWSDPRAVHGKHSYSLVLTPAGGLDFPLKRGGTAFVEVRFDYRITDLYLPSIGVGYTF